MLRPGTVVGRYELTRRLGEGNFGEVWQAKLKGSEYSSFFAIKFPKRSDVDRRALKEEAANWLLASGHSNVVSFIEAFETDDPEATYSAEPAAQLFLLVSEYIAGGTLEKWLAENGGTAPSIEDAVEIMLGILAGLEQLHQNKVIHRDLKPANILLQGKTLKLADFGLSRVVTTTSKQSSKPSGTPAYMPPEAFDGKRTELTDIWSAGAIFYELVCGSLPFPQRDMTALVKAIVLDEPKPLPASVPAGLRAIIMRCLAKEPRQRYASAATLRAALKDWQQPANPKPKSKSKPPAPAPPKPEPDGNTQPNSRVKVAAALGVLALVVVLSGIWAIRPKGSTGRVALPSTNFVEPLENEVKLEMVAVPGGSFQMGSRENDEGGYKDERPPHKVTLLPFHISKFEVTQAQWRVVARWPKKYMDLEADPAYFKGDNLPVERVSYWQAREFCTRLSNKTGRRYLLPSEAEWEYAARAGSQSRYSFGDDVSELYHYAWYEGNSDYSMSRRQTHPVGQLRPNEFGLFDMHGNVWEWCEDVWHDNYNGSDRPDDGSSWLSGRDSSNRVLRGGSWYDLSGYCRSANRGNNAPGNRDNDHGFRVVVLSRIL